MNTQHLETEWKNVQQTLKGLLHKKDLSYRDVAEQTGISAPTLTRLLREDFPPDRPDYFYKLLKMFYRDLESEDKKTLIALADLTGLVNDLIADADVISEEAKYASPYRRSSLQMLAIDEYSRRGQWNEAIRCCYIAAHDMGDISSQALKARVRAVAFQINLAMYQEAIDALSELEQDIDRMDIETQLLFLKTRARLAYHQGLSNKALLLIDQAFKLIEPYSKHKSLFEDLYHLRGCIYLSWAKLTQVIPSSKLKISSDYPWTKLATTFINNAITDFQDSKAIHNELELPVAAGYDCIRLAETYIYAGEYDKVKASLDEAQRLMPPTLHLTHCHIKLITGQLLTHQYEKLSVDRIKNELIKPWRSITYRRGIAEANWLIAQQEYLIYSQEKKQNVEQLVSAVQAALNAVSLIKFEVTRLNIEIWCWLYDLSVMIDSVQYEQLVKLLKQSWNWQSDSNFLDREQRMRQEKLIRVLEQRSKLRTHVTEIIEQTIENNLELLKGV